MHREVRPREAAVRWNNGESGRLGDDRGIGADSSVDDRARANAAVFLIRHCGDDDLASEPRVERVHRRGAHRGNPRFHVRGTTPIESAIANGGVPRRVHHPLDADGIEVAVEEQGTVGRPVGGGMLGPSNHVWSSWAGVHQRDVESPTGEDLGQPERDGLFARRIDHEGRIAGIHGDKRSRKCERVAARNSNRSHVISRDKNPGALTSWAPVSSWQQAWPVPSPPALQRAWRLAWQLASPAPLQPASQRAWRPAWRPF